ncbi:MAG: MFS transporter [Bacteroidales bacterium]|nr:MFS transporter [Bacteroidales bacterium]MDY0215796.1 MFS transporter [Bacteroidales bacterium]
MTNKVWTTNFILLVLGNFLLSISFYFLITVLPVYLVDEIHFSKSDAGIILSAYIFTAVLVRPFVGPLIDTYGRKTIYLSALMLFAILFPAYAISASYVPLIVLRILHGVSWGILTTAGNTLAMDLLPEEKKGEGMGFYGLAFTLAMAIGPFIASFVLNIGNFGVLFIAAGFLAFSGMGTILMVGFPKNERKRAFSLKLLKDFIAPQTYRYALLLMIIMLPYGALINFASLFCLEVLPGRSYIFFLSLAVGLTISRLFAGKIFDKRGYYELLIFSFSFIAIGFPIFVFFNHPFFLALSSVIIGIGYGISFLILQLVINQVLPKEKRGTANSIFLTALDIGIAGGTVLMGIFSDIFGLKLSFLTFVIFPIICLIIFVSPKRTLQIK